MLESYQNSLLEFALAMHMLKRERSLFLNLAEQTKCIVFEVSQTSHIIFCNPPALALFRCTLGEVVGKDFEVFYQDHFPKSSWRLKLSQLQDPPFMDEWTYRPSSSDSSLRLKMMLLKDSHLKSFFLIGYS